MTSLTFFNLKLAEGGSLIDQEWFFDSKTTYMVELDSSKFLKTIWRHVIELENPPKKGKMRLNQKLTGSKTQENLKKVLIKNEHFGARRLNFVIHTI